METLKIGESGSEDDDSEELKVKIDFKFRAEGQLKEMAEEMGKARRDAHCDSMEDALAQIKEHGF